MVYSDDNIRTQLESSDIGGGEEYTESQGKLHPSDADTEVSSVSGLESAVNSSAAIVAVADGDYDMTGTQMEIGDTTIVGYRGWDGSDGAYFHTDSGGEMSPYRYYRMFHSDSGGCRLTGFRMHGHDPYDDFSEGPGSRDNAYAENLSNGIKLRGTGCEIDNMEMWGFPWCSVHLRGNGSRVSADIHHNDFHKNYQIGYGYAVNFWINSEGDVYRNYFNGQRHSINGRGNHNIDYDIYENIFGSNHYSHMVDMHCRTENMGSNSSDPSAWNYHLRAGGDMYVRRNTFCTDSTNAVGLRGYPWDGMTIHNNRFTHNSRPTENPNTHRTSVVWYANNMEWSGVDSYPPRDSEGYPANWSDYDNQFGAPDAEYSTEYGAPLNLTGDTPTPTGDLSVFAEDASTGSRIDGAEVYVEWLEDDPHEDDDQGPHEGVTGDSDVAGGGHDFGDLPIGYYHIEVDHEDYDLGTYDEELWRNPGEGENEAMYLDTDGRLPIIYLDYTGEDLPTEWGGETDSNGIVDFGPAEQHADYHVEISADGYHSKSVIYTNESEEMHTLELDPDTYGDDRITVFVTDRNGTAISGVTATLYEPDEGE